MDKQTKKSCSFCGQIEGEINGVLIEGVHGRICSDCTKNAFSIVERINTEATEKQQHPSFIPKLQSPSHIKKKLDEYVIGQHDAKEVLCVAVYNHYKRLLQSSREQEKHNGIEISKSNVLLIGETGTGKTLLAKTISRFLEVPFSIVDATAFTQAGYVGEDVESMLTRLLQACDYDIAKAEKGIIFIDEIDKIARKGENPSITRDVAGEGVQQSLLKLLEGTEVLVPPQGGRKHPEQPMLKVNTQHILFLCGGSFDGLKEIISRRTSFKGIGFQNKEAKTPTNIQHAHIVGPQDLKRYGLIPELIGRLAVVAQLQPMDENTLVRILKEPKNALIKQYQALLEMDNIMLSIDQDAIHFIAKQALTYQLGARGLRSVCERIFNPLFFKITDKKRKKKILLTKKKASDLYFQSLT